MASDTATIRVARRTRDLLARQARDRGLSVSAMLARLAEDVDRQAILRAERDASRLDAEDASVQAEERQWDAALGDGID